MRLSGETQENVNIDKSCIPFFTRFAHQPLLFLFRPLKSAPLNLCGNNSLSGRREADVPEGRPQGRSQDSASSLECDDPLTRWFSRFHVPFMASYSSENIMDFLSLMHATLKKYHRLTPGKLFLLRLRRQTKG